MIKKIKLLLLVFILFLGFSNCYAYTKDDIVNLASSIDTCSSDTASIVSGFKATYTRLINERDVSSEDLNQIYNNISTVKGILSAFSVCSKESLSALPSSVKDQLYSLYKQTNKLITSSPKYVDIIDNNETTNNEEAVQMIIDSSNKKVNVYEEGTLINVVGNYEKLNYVGLNKILIGIIVFFVILLIIMSILKGKFKKSIFITSIMYVSIFTILFMVVFRNNISSYLDILSNMSVDVSDKQKDVRVQGKKIISYPSYGVKYATMYIGERRESIYFGDSSEILSKGIGHMTSSSLPGEGGKTILSGHNTGLFRKLFDLEKNDEIIIDTIYGKFTYKFKGSKVVEDTDISSIEEDYDLILYTCYPNTNIYGNKRLVVYLNLVSSDWLGDKDEN